MAVFTRDRGEYGRFFLTGFGCVVGNPSTLLSLSLSQKTKKKETIKTAILKTESIRERNNSNI